MMKTIWREQIDGGSIQVLPIAESGTFLFVEYIYNFIRDGLLVLRKDDVSKSETTKTDSFQDAYLQSSIGCVPDFDCRFSEIETWRELLAKVPTIMPVCLEEENEGLIYMGLITSVHDDRFDIHEFLGSGRWNDDLTTVYFDDLTCFQAGNGYLNMYEKILDPSPQQVAERDSASRHL